MLTFTCPWCGTTYDTFRSNCKNCGGPIPSTTAPKMVAVDPIPQSDPQAALLPPPPPPPREISDTYTFKLMLTDSASVAGLVLGLIGGFFTLTGIILTLFVVTAFVGLPFALIGVLFMLIGGGLLYGRYHEKQKIVNVLKYGQAVCGEVTGVQENLMVRVNRRHPWVIEYRFRANGQVYAGSTSTFNHLTAYLRPGGPAYVLYQPDAPELNMLYPHP